MSTTAGSAVSQEFSKPGVHSLTYKDDFCNFAADLRAELLHFPRWEEMRQSGPGGTDELIPERMNGITTDHIREEDRDLFPHSRKFADFLARNVGTLCPLVGVNPAEAMGIEMNAMAYGAGGWLSPHTDYLEYGHPHSRLVAWMLYLTAPEDGEWSPEKGGAVRVWKPGGGEARVRPRFNRFAMFRVQNDSFHEVEKITWEPQWPNCRLALSGWIRGPVLRTVQRKTRLYLQSQSAREKQEKVAPSLQGSLALRRLMAKQKSYSGRDTAVTATRISELEELYQAHLESPAGTSFLRLAPGPAGVIIVVDEAGNTVYFGTREEYDKKLP